MASLPKTYIIELNSSHVQVIAQLLHMAIVGTDDRVANEALDSLMLQAEGVYREPKQHRVFSNAVEAPARAVKFPDVWYTPNHNSPMSKIEPALD